MGYRAALIKIAVALLCPLLPLIGQTWQELQQQADSLYRAGAHDSAIVVSKLSLDAAKAEFGSEDTTVAKSLLLIASGVYLQRRYAEAESFYTLAKKTWQAVSDSQSLFVAKTLHGLATTYWARQRYADAVNQFQQALEMTSRVAGGTDPLCARILASLSVVRRSQGRWEEAISCAQRSLEITESAKGPDHPDVAEALRYIGVYLRDLGRYSDAEPLLLRALSIRERHYGSQDLSVAECLNSLGIVYEHLRQFDKSEKLYKRALGIRRQSPESSPYLVSESLINLALLCIAAENFEGAESHLREAVQLAGDSYGEYSFQAASPTAALGNVLTVKGELAEAEELLMRAITIWQAESSKGEFANPSYGLGLLSLAHLQLKKGKHSRASGLYQQAIDTCRALFGLEHPLSALALEESCRLHHALGQFERGLYAAKQAYDFRAQAFARGAAVMSEKDALDFSYQLRRSAGTYLTLYLAADDPDQKSRVEAANIVLSSKGVVSDQLFTRHQRMVRETDAQTQLLAESYRQARFDLAKTYVAVPDAADVAASRRKLDSLTAVVTELEKELARCSNSFRESFAEKSFDAAEISQVLPDNSVIIEYMLWEMQLPEAHSRIPHYLVLTKDNLDRTTISDLGPAAVIDSLVSRYRNHMLRISSRMATLDDPDAEEYARLADALYELILAPIDSCFAEEQLLIVSPDGALNLVSFAGLVRPNGRYLIEDHSLHYVSAARDILRLQSDHQPGSGLIILADPNFDVAASAAGRHSQSGSAAEGRTHAIAFDRQLRGSLPACGVLSDSRLARLPGTSSEAKLVAMIWQERMSESLMVFLDSSATEAAFKSNAPGNRVIHIATHGYFCPPGDRGSDRAALGTYSQQFAGSNPLLFSGFHLAGSNLAQEMSASEDGIVTAYEIADLSLEGVQLVVLSACESGLGDVKQGEGVYGLRRAFQLAGGRTIVSSLWPVSDRLTTETMSYLYENIDRSLPAVIRERQVQMIDELRNAGYNDHPYKWAAFIAIGDWR